METVYSVSAASRAIEQLLDQGYELIQLREGVLGIGDCVLLSHDASKYSFIFREKYLNEWSSGQIVRRFSKISKKLQEEIDTSENAEGAA